MVCRDIDLFFNRCTERSATYIQTDDYDGITFPSNLCSKCDEGFYVSKTRCVENGEYWDEDDTKNISELVGFVNCI